MSKNIQVCIESMAFKGYGVARHQGKVIFIPYSVTGDEAWVEIVKEKKNYCFGRLSRVVNPSPLRTDPQCPHFGVCGGCQWQHIDYPVQSKLKKEILIESLRRIGTLQEIPSITVVPSPRPYAYRMRVQLKVKGKGTGYYQESSKQLVDIDHCPIAHPLINKLIHLLREEQPSFSSFEEIEINISPEEEKGILILYSLSPQQGFKKKFLKEFLQRHPVLKGIAVRRKGEMNLLGDPSLNFTLSSGLAEGEGSLKLRASPESFFQVNPEQNRTLIRTVLECCDPGKEQRILDLYAGIGNLTLPLASRMKEVVGIEESRMTIEDARFNAERNGMKNCVFIPGRVEDILNRWKGGDFDLLVLDPPRTGCKTVLDPIVRLNPKKIVYVSCEPTTLSRDLRVFCGKGYLLQKLTLIDMFPQTYHMEVVALLKSKLS